MLPAASWLVPMMRPGMVRMSFWRVAMKAACGPPNPSGMPKRWAEPITTSAPWAPADFSSTAASGSVPTQTFRPAA